MEPNPSMWLRGQTLGNPLGFDEGAALLRYIICKTQSQNRGYSSNPRHAAITICAGKSKMFQRLLLIMLNNVRHCCGASLYLLGLLLFWSIRIQIKYLRVWKLKE
ncbi:OLC1v1013803C1 [Oldenlandia corymbosa var. corymbosa]|uniref:OLC1v1013803C1 n=1 Tax=Oldenlandia corymbosa var. corymbosa TaxID=529605 RepID=A0AAV1E2G8_OLDCO|nr:OLC1v1013803C1 [Oldenlandia corymbosa var. corymbosa]